MNFVTEIDYIHFINCLDRLQTIFSGSLLSVLNFKLRLVMIYFQLIILVLCNFFTIAKLRTYLFSGTKFVNIGLKLLT